MLAGKNPNKEDVLTQIILKNPGISTKTSWVLFKKLGIDTSIQRIHALVKNLIEDKVVLKQKKRLYINEEWLNDLQEYLPKKPSFSISEGESLRWKFNSLEHLDEFWKTLTFQLVKKHKEIPIFLYVPYDIWKYAPERSSSECDFYDYLEEKQRQSYYLIGNNENFDRQSQKERDRNFIKSTQNKHKGLGEEHLVVIKDTVIKTRLKEMDMEKIKDCYKENLTIDLFQEEITKILAEIKSASFTVENNKEKAKNLRKKIAKDFYVPKTIIEKYDLW